MATNSKRIPTTYGALRKLLAEAGDPWRPDPTKSDDEPLPEYPTGGDGVYEPDTRTIGIGGVDDVLKQATPPTNPDLRAVWSEEGMLPDEAGESPRPQSRSQGRSQSRSRKTSATTPAPDSGG